MDLNIKPCSCLCSLERFDINGISAHYTEFGDKYDYDEENAVEYGCGDMQFDAKPCNQNILDKYNITIDEYNEICGKLEDVLSFGSCGWCI